MQATLNKPSQPVTLWGIFRRFWKKISFTTLLVVVEAFINLLFPLFIGFTINGLLRQSYIEVIWLGALGILALIVGSGRRFYDTRAYSDAYITLSGELVEKERAKENSDVSATAARASLLTEFVEFLENSLPSIITGFIGMVGILVIIFTLSQPVFWAALALLVFMGLIYLLSGRKNFRLNKAYNDQLEKQWTILSTQGKNETADHFKTLMRWNIKLSDLETVNFGFIWIGIIALLVYAPIAVIEGGVSNYGLVFSTLMYVFQYIESMVMLPIFIQQLIRLQEISGRLSNG